MRPHTTPILPRPITREEARGGISEILFDGFRVRGYMTDPGDQRVIPTQDWGTSTL
jgi:hypothetical protein